MSLTRKPIFWIIFTALFCAGIIFTAKFFSSAFPIINLEITADRAEVIKKAHELATQYTWGPTQAHSAASFETDTIVKTYVELDAGGKQALKDMLVQDFYMPYTWQVRFFKEHEVNETTVIFTPTGEFYGFKETIAQATPGAALTENVAQSLAEKAASAWGIPLDAYTLVEPSHDTKLNGRVDHTFVYERKDAHIGQGKYRLTLVVTGDKLTQLTHSVFVPENFLHRYQEMRSANNSIAYGSSIFFLVFYIIVGCCGSLFFLMRRRFVIWQPAIKWGFFVALVTTLATANQLPLWWMRYDTALSITTFLAQTCMTFFLFFLKQLALLVVTFAAAESLTRKAFGYQPQLWTLWQPAHAASWQVLGRTVGGYLFAGAHLGFTVALYIVTTKFFGWWIPSEELFNPNVIATYAPWLTPLANSLSASFLEECLFRAVPLSIAALIGKRYGHQRAWIIGAMILQAIVFGAAHAHYPAMPAYARIVELIIPSFLFGGIYLIFGLLPSIIAHFLYDVVWFSIPVFINVASGAWLNKLVIIIGSAIPLLVVLYGRLKTKKWHTLAASAYNNAWHPTPTKEVVHTQRPAHEWYVIPSKTQKLMFIVGIASFCVWFLIGPKKDTTQGLRLNRQTAIAHAQAKLAQDQVTIDNSWRVLSSIIAPKEMPERMMEHRFVWQQNPEIYHELMNASFLRSPFWTIRFIKKTGTVDERAEEYHIQLNDTGVQRVVHALAQSAPGKNISREDAQTIAHTFVAQHFNIAPSNIKNISVQAIKMPARLDWFVTLQDTGQHLAEDGQDRMNVYIAGNTVTDATRFVHVPEQWQRTEQRHISQFNIVMMICMGILYAFVFLGVFVMQRHVTFAISRVFIFFALFSSLALAAFINSWPTKIMQFSAITPWTHQVFSTLGSLGVTIITFSIFLTYIALLVCQYRPHSSITKNIRSLCVGIAAGFFCSAVIIFLQTILPTVEPLWADYEAAAYFWPFLGIIIKNVVNFFIMSSLLYIIMIALDHYMRLNKWSVLLFFVVGLCVAPKIAAGSLLAWLVLGLAVGALLLVLYILFLRYDLCMTFVITGTYIITTIAQQVMFNAYPGVALAGVVSCVLIAVLAGQMFKKL